MAKIIEAQFLVWGIAILSGCSSSTTNERIFESGGAAGAAGAAVGGSAGQTGGEAGMAGQTAVGGSGGQDAEGGTCVPLSCETLGYQCGTVSDGCGFFNVCGSPYVRHPEEDYPALDVQNHGCTKEFPHAWACGPYPAPGGERPFQDCIRWEGSATWCCVESA